ncbi:MAG: hypothetical protein ACI9XO_003851 [Paraglaciecola sp.]
MYNIDMSKFFNDKYFPTDMFRNDGSFWEYSLTKEEELLLAIDETMASVTEVLRTRNPSREILDARSILSKRQKSKYGKLEELIKQYRGKIDDRASNSESLRFLPYFVEINRLLKKLIQS